MTLGSGLKKGARPALGRGLSALVSTAVSVPPVQTREPAVNTDTAMPAAPANAPAASQEAKGEAPTVINISEIIANPEQPRQAVFRSGAWRII